MNRPIHFEIHSTDVKATNRFFAEVFGWQLSQWGNMDYYLATTGQKPADGIDGGTMPTRDGQCRTVNTLDVADLDATLAKVKAAGGQQVVDRMPVPGVGHLAYCKDPAGVLFGLIQMDSGAK